MAANLRAQEQFSKFFPVADVELIIEQITRHLHESTQCSRVTISKKSSIHTITIHQDGCVYISTDGSQPELTDEFIADITDGVSKNISESHPS